MPTIKGKWRWNDGIENAPIPTNDIFQAVTFISGKWYEDGSSAYDRINILGVSDNNYDPPRLYISYRLLDSVMALDFINWYKASGVWFHSVYENLRIMDFGEAEQEVSEEFYNFLIANAKPTIAEMLTQIAENEQKVYDTGYNRGNADGHTEGYQKGYDDGNAEGKAEGIDEGKKAEYDAFWDAFQKNGTRRYYERAFSDTVNNGRMWQYGKTYRPKHPIKPLNAQEMYTYGYLPYEAIAAVDFSECKDFYCTFSYFAISNADKKFPPIDISSATRTQSIFGWSTGIKEIEELWVSENTPYSACFTGATNLVEIRFKGTIAQKGLDFKDCSKLSKESIENVIEHLSVTTSGLTVTFSKAAVNKAFETSTDANDGETSAEWIALRGTKSNWTFTLS